MVWYENDGTPNNDDWTQHDIDTSFLQARNTDVVDIDNDGDLDVLGVANTGDELAWWENTAIFALNPTWTTYSINASADGASEVFVADIDGDGDKDVVAAIHFDNQVAWYENDGDPSDGGWTHHIIKDYEDACGTCGGMDDVFVADMDGDGLMDLAVLSKSKHFYLLDKLQFVVHPFWLFLQPIPTLSL